MKAHQPYQLKEHYFVSCPKGLENLLLQEAQEVGFRHCEIANSGVICTGYNEKALELLLRTRFASRIFKQIYQFTISKEKDLYFLARNIKWKTYFTPEQSFKIKTTLSPCPETKRRSPYTNPLILSQIFKDGLVDRFRDDFNERPSVEKISPDISIHLHVTPTLNEKTDTVIVSLDLCGEPLSNRGYRHPQAAAPLRENLAAALGQSIELQKPLYDLMCGSATLLIETALAEHNIPASYLHLLHQQDPWIFKNTLWFKKDPYLIDNFKKLKAKYRQQAQQKLAQIDQQSPSYFGFDQDPKAVALAQEQVQIAGLQSIIRISQQDALKVRPQSQNGTILSNLPYGVRLEQESEDLEQLYYQLGEHLKAMFKGWNAYLFMEQAPLMKKIELKGDRKLIFYNGQLECRLIRYRLF